MKSFILGVNSIRRDHISLNAWNMIIWLVCKRRRSAYTLNGEDCLTFKVYRPRLYILLTLNSSGTNILLIVSPNMP